MSVKKIVVIGGSAAGAKAAAKARRCDQKAQITIVQKVPDLSMASCGYPYYLGGTFNNRNALLCTPTGVVRDAAFFKKVKDIDAIVNTECVAIDRTSKTVSCLDRSSGTQFDLPYDKLVLSMGAKPRKLPIEGYDLKGVSQLLSMQDTDYLQDLISSETIKEAVIVGGGLIGVEACEALVARGIKVTLLEAAPQILPMLDEQFAALVVNHMKAKGVQVFTSMKLQGFVGKAGAVAGARLGDGTVISCQMAIVCCGIQPNTELAVAAGLTTGITGGIVVNEFMQTSDPDIYAAGDCVECKNILTNRACFAPMGDLANLQGRVVGQNVITEQSAQFPGTTQTAICKVFDFTAGVSGLTSRQAEAAGIDCIESSINASPDKPGFMGAGLLISKMIADRKTGRILGYQCIGNGDVSRSVATAAMAIKGKLDVIDVSCADLPYAPPYSLAIDHFITAAHVMDNKLKGNYNTVSAKEVKEKIEAKEKVFFLDGRSPDEYEVMRLGIGEVLIPLGALRSKLDMLPADKSAEIICFCKISLRGYETALILREHGYTNVKVMEGGIMAWPYARAV